LVKFAGRQFANFTTREGLCGNGVLGITRDKEGDLWFASYEGGLCCYDSQRFEDRSALVGSDLSIQFWSAATDASGALWFGSSNGLFRYIDDHVTTFNQENGLNHRKVLSLLPSESGGMYIGTSKGLNFIKPGTDAASLVAEVPRHRIRNILKAKDGSLWLASNKGLHILSGSELRSFTTEEGLSSNSTYCLAIDPEGRTWVGTDNGLNILTGDSVKQLTIEGIFGSNVINFLKLVDDVMYVGTNSGLFTVHSLGELESLVFNNFSVHDGLVSMETNLNAVFSDGNGVLWFGTAEGLVRANLDAIQQQQNLPPPTLVVDDVKVNLESRNWKESDAEIDPRTGQPTSLDLAYNSNNITVYFTGISTTYPESVTYEYLMDGYDSEWQRDGTVDFAHYRNLPYDDFQFRVVAINKEGARSDEVVVDLSIIPPFWFRGWFIALA
ncbi:MAG: hypothetical protein HKN32_08955, partial [Flavobacteriales bacterium]|nr:hypothetical protein [Flavobacteriales bacterium]